MSKIDKLRLIPAGTKVFSISLQQNVMFDRDVVVKAQHTVIGDDRWVFGTIQEITGLTSIPGHYDKAHSELSFNYKETKPYTLPEPMIMDWKYDTKEKKAGMTVTGVLFDFNKPTENGNMYSKECIEDIKKQLETLRSSGKIIEWKHEDDKISVTKADWITLKENVDLGQMKTFTIPVQDMSPSESIEMLKRVREELGVPKKFFDGQPTSCGSMHSPNKPLSPPDPEVLMKACCDYITCPDCKGKGFYYFLNEDEPIIDTKCSTCQGWGIINPVTKEPYTKMEGITNTIRYTKCFHYPTCVIIDKNNGEGCVLNCVHKTIVTKHSVEIPPPPKPPLSKADREGTVAMCPICGSTASKKGFMGLFGERTCDNKECSNSKSKNINWK